MVHDTEFVSMVDCLAHAFVIYSLEPKKKFLGINLKHFIFIRI